MVQAGDVLQTIHHNSYHEFVPSTLSEEALLPYNDQPVIGVIMGPQDKNFTDESIAIFTSQEYTVSATSDRMGYRLEGAALTLRNAKELVSEGMTFGSIQVPASGQPIIMMADCPTTGGYSKIGNVISADLPLLAQCVPNKSRIRFQKTTVANAQKKYREQMMRLDKGIIQIEENDAWLI